ncbi:MAG: CRISPR-associated endonuclease Cas2 [Eubacteriales bacterium]|nr:CRISPR-associated endonuclease Cas2 [Eubacteriales bacterium]
MRMMIMFDLPVDTAAERREYRKFVKFLKEEGFILFQESIYVKLSMNESNVKLTETAIQLHLPSKGLVSLLTVTEKQFQDIDYLLGEFHSDVVASPDRVIEL